LVGSVAGHNTYGTNLVTSGVNARIMWSTDRNRWEVLADVSFDNIYTADEVLHFNTANTSPNPPAFGVGSWTSTPFGCGSMMQFSGPSTSSGVVPVITANPPNRTICAGGNTTFAVTATG